MSRTTATRVATVPCPFCEKLNRVDLERLDARPKCGQCGRPLLLDRPVRVSDQDLERVVADATVPVLVDFYADWCAPCKMMAPAIDDAARQRAGTILFGKLDTDRNPTMAVRFAIRGIPTLILFRHGREAARQTGAMPPARFSAGLDEALARSEG